ncbi:MAG: phosphomannomutase [Proteobacteria bacterium]|nr:phosphomannomutase [Pseudomonadota bacterium]
MVEEISCFKAYDLRGRIPDEINEDIAYRVGRAYAAWLQPARVVVGHDIRLSSPGMCQALIGGLLEGGVDVFHIGQCGTEEIYFATSHFEMDGGIVITASHNPKNYNGMKLVREESKPISSDSGLDEIKALAEANEFEPVAKRGQLVALDHHAAYCAKLLSYVDIAKLKPLKVVVNAGNGGAGAVIDRIEKFLPLQFIKVHHQADGNFPNGVPNPLLPENRVSTINAINEHQADIGIAWDGDFDRCFFFDADGRFIEGYYIVGLLAEAFLERDSDNRIIHDPRLTWNTIDIVSSKGGTAVQSKTGHAFIKERMRLEDAIYGGEMSAHHYFRDFSYCDSGMVPWLLVVGLMSAKNKTLAELVDARISLFPASGEINRRIDDAAAVLITIEDRYAAEAISIDHTDGLSMEFDDWRFNLRMSNTEPVVRLNVESRGNPELMQSKTQDILNLMGGEQP